FRACVNIFYWADPPVFPPVAPNAKGDPIVTDGRMVALALNDCHSPRLSTETVDATPLAEHGGLVQRFARREILSARNGLLRTNPYWRTFEAPGWFGESFRG